MMRIDYYDIYETAVINSLPKENISLPQEKEVKHDERQGIFKRIFCSLFCFKRRSDT